jgi:CheY-like chemotaxis protein
MSGTTSGGNSFPLTPPRRFSYMCGVAPATKEGDHSAAMSALHEFDQLAGIRVLVVEDHDDSRDVLEQVLEHVGALVVASRSADEALPHVDQVDVVVTDIAMPGHDGFWLLHEVQRRHRSVPVIAVSGYSDLQERALREAAFARVLRKPIDPWLLCREVAAVVRSREV